MSEAFNDRFEISDRLLGSGMYSKVYLATDLAAEKQVACKVVDLGFVNKEARKGRPRERLRLLEEVDLLSKLNHVCGTDSISSLQALTKTAKHSQPSQGVPLRVFLVPLSRPGTWRRSHVLRCGQWGNSNQHTCACCR